VFVPVYLISLQDPGYRVVTIVAIAVGIVSDILDGFLARKLGQVSDLGKILDPAADKICTALLVISLHFYSDFPLWAVILILARDLTVLLVSMSFLRKTGLISTSNMTGRFAALSWGLVILVFVIDLEPLEVPVLVVATALVGLSAVSYANMLLRLLKSRRVVRDVK
jgi:CDP-diacylglycerol--glycerol-3-phosphate 3-phosphatidyltransferase